MHRNIASSMRPIAFPLRTHPSLLFPEQPQKRLCHTSDAASILSVDFISQSLRARVADQAAVLGDMKAWHTFPLLYNTIPLVVGLTSLGFSHALTAWFLILLHHDGLLMVGSIGWFHLLVSMGGGVSVLLGCLFGYRQRNYSTYLK